MFASWLDHIPWDPRLGLHHWSSSPSNRPSAHVRKRTSASMDSERPGARVLRRCEAESAQSQIQLCPDPPTAAQPGLPGFQTASLPQGPASGPGRAARLAHPNTGLPADL